MLSELKHQLIIVHVQCMCMLNMVNSTNILRESMTLFEVDRVFWTRQDFRICLGEPKGYIYIVISIHHCCTYCFMVVLIGRSNVEILKARQDRSPDASRKLYPPRKGSWIILLYILLGGDVVINDNLLLT